MQIHIEISESDLKRIIQKHIEEKTGNPIDMRNITILVKSKQNFRSEWEPANFKAEYNNYIKD